MDSKIDLYFDKESKWKEASKLLRTIILDCGLTEEFKWKHPCYSYKQSNIVLIHSFKEYCALLFFKGSLLNDTNGILVQQTENVQAARQIRFANTQEIVDLKDVVKTYVFEAIEVEKAGLKVAMKRTQEFNIAQEFQEKLDDLSDLKTAFEALTPGRQRGYLLYFSSPKQSKTRTSRVEKCIPKIMDGKGLNDR